MQVFNNVPAFGVWTNYTNSVEKMRSSMGKLSTGLRIRTADDDPAGLAMSERMRSQIRNSAMAAQNIQNAQAYMRTADSWMQKIQDMLHRMSELAVSANDGTKTQVDRDNLQLEFEQMQEEITRITTGGSLARGQFNNAALFAGGNLLVTQVGADPGQLFCGVSLALHSGSSASIGSTNTVFTSGTTASVEQDITWSMVLARGGAAGTATAMGIQISTMAGAARSTAVLRLAVDYLSNQRATIGAQISRLGHSLDGIRAYQENIMGAESQIRDTDMALESANFMKYQILTQVGTAMLAQANALPSSVLQLIG